VTFRGQARNLLGLWGAAGTFGLGLGAVRESPGAAPNQALQRTGQPARSAPAEPSAELHSLGIINHRHHDH
jgi:hypothetical protein